MSTAYQSMQAENREKFSRFWKIHYFTSFAGETVFKLPLVDSKSSITRWIGKMLIISFGERSNVVHAVLKPTM